MRHLKRAALAAPICTLALCPAAHAAPVLVFDDGKVSVRQDPALDGTVPGGLATSGGSAAACRACRPAPGAGSSQVSVAASRGDPVKRALRRAASDGHVSAEDATRYRGIYSRALSVRRKLGFTRGAELGYVITTLQRIARRGGLVAARMPALFLLVDRNREWWGSKGAPGSGARVRFGASRVIFQYYPGHGLQLQPLANFGAANGYWYSKRDESLRTLVDELVELRVVRDGFASWEYYFDFGGGSPPWISGMAQGTAVQALARASARLADPSLVQVATQALGAFERRTPVGARVPAGNGAWYALYSFAPSLEVLNGMLQSLVGLKTFATLTGDLRAAALFDEGDRVARARVSLYDTGAWSLYSRSGGRPGAEANLNYHTLNRDFARNLCKLTSADAYCSAADRFTKYLREDPTLDPFGPVPAPARGGRGVRFNFTLSKISRVGITVTGGGRTYLSTSGSFSRGKRYFRWVPPRLRTERTYDYKLFARDLAGNTASFDGTLRVKAGG
jgi:hypothetical protein